MADEEHLQIIRQGVDVWNEWRHDNPELIPNLSGADLSEADLCEAYLTMADLSGYQHISLEAVEQAYQDAVQSVSI